MDFLYDKIPYALALGGIFAMGLLFSCTVVGRVLRDDEIRDKIMSEENVKEMKRRLAQKKYERSFYDELEALENKDLTKEDMEKLSKLYITEDTPIGKIKMCYSCETETFWYYSKNKNISYPTLDAVARKYAIQYNCSQICINYRNEVEKINKKQTENNYKDDKEVSNEVTPSIYVKFKSYNNNNNNNNNMKKALVTVERSNRFTYKGDIMNDNLDTTPIEVQKISFSEYKKLLEKKDSDKIKTS